MKENKAQRNESLRRIKRKFEDNNQMDMMDCSNFPLNRDNMRDFVRMVINVQTNKQTKQPNNQPTSQSNNQIKKTTKPTDRPNEPTKPTDRPTNQPTPWSRVLLEKLTVLQLRKIFTVFYDTWTPPIFPCREPE